MNKIFKKNSIYTLIITLVMSLFILNGCLSLSSLKRTEVATEDDTQPALVSKETTTSSQTIESKSPTKVKIERVDVKRAEQTPIFKTKSEIPPTSQVEVKSETIPSVAIKKDTTKRSIVNNKIILKRGDKVFFVGDSLMQGVAPHVRQVLTQKYGIESIDLSKQSSGLRNLKFYNWPKVIEDTFAKNPDIKLMVVYLGPNDPWGFSNMAFKSSAWEKAYRERITQIIKTAQSYGARVLWLGVPDMKKKELHDGMVYLNELYRSEVKKNRETYQSSREILGSTGDQFVSQIQRNGKNIQVRAGDGVHFTVAGQKVIAETVLDYIRTN